MTSRENFAERLNLFYYKQHLRKLKPGDIETARNWCMDFIRREHPHFTDEEAERFYENLIRVEFTPVDEWTQRMS